MYESPINAICSEITHKILKNQEENMMLEVQQAIGYGVDKDELIKALRYDRNQYEKGFRDGLSENDRILLDGMRNTAFECGCRGGDVEFKVHQTLKRMGRDDLLPPCERCKTESE